MAARSDSLRTNHADVEAASKGEDRAMVALAGLAAANTRTPLLAVGPLLPLISAELRLPATTAGLLTALPLLLMGLLSLPAGLLADRVGPRRLMAVTQVGLVLAGLARAFATDVLQLLAATVVLGAAIGLSNPLFPQVAREARTAGVGVATAIYSNGFTLGALITLGITVPVLLPWLGGSWRLVLAFWAVIALVSAVGWLLLALRKDPARQVRGGSASRWSLLEVLRLPGLAHVAWLFMAQSAIFYALAAWIPTIYVAQGWSLADAALPLLVFQMASASAGLLTPFVASRWLGLKRTLLVGSVCSTLGMLGLVLAPTVMPAVWVVLSGIGVSVVFVLTLVGSAVVSPADRVGVASGAVFTLGYLGSMVGPFVVGWMRDLTGEFGPGMVLLLALSATKILTSVLLPPTLNALRSRPS